MTLQSCDLPRTTCIFLDKRAEIIVERGWAKWITEEHAKTIVSETHKQGLVHLAFHQSKSPDQHLSEICSCCPCCCQALQGLLQMNMKGLVEPSEFVATFDPETCSQCNICVDRCQFEARGLDSNGNIVFRQDLCFGCSLCVTTCPENSIELIRRTFVKIIYRITPENPKALLSGIGIYHQRHRLPRGGVVNT